MKKNQNKEQSVSKKSEDLLKRLLSKDKKVYTEVFLNSKCCCDC